MHACVYVRASSSLEGVVEECTGASYRARFFGCEITLQQITLNIWYTGVEHILAVSHTMQDNEAKTVLHPLLPPITEGISLEGLVGCKI